MLYETILKLTQLKPVKWYNFVTKYKNYMLLYHTLSDLRTLLTISANDKELCNKLIDFLLGADALKELVNPAGYGINIYKADETITSYLCSTACFHVNIIGTGLTTLNLFIDQQDKRIEIKYSVERIIENTYKDVFVISNDSAIPEQSLTAVRKFVISEIQFIIEGYIRGITKTLYDQYT